MAFDPVYMPLERVWDVAQLPVLVVARVSVVLQCFRFLSLPLLDHTRVVLVYAMAGLYTLHHMKTALPTSVAARHRGLLVDAFLFSCFCCFFRVFDDRSLLSFRRNFRHQFCA